MNSFNISNSLRGIQDLIENNSYEVDPETGEILADNTEELKELLSVAVEDRDNKVNSICYMKKYFKSEEDAIAIEIKRLQDRKVAMISKGRQLNELLDMLLDGEKVKTTLFTAYYQTTQSIEFNELFNIDTLDNNYVKVKREPILSKLKKDIKEGLDIVGVSIISKTGVRVR